MPVDANSEKRESDEVLDEFEMQAARFDHSGEKVRLSALHMERIGDRESTATALVDHLGERAHGEGGHHGAGFHRILKCWR